MAHRETRYACSVSACLRSVCAWLPFVFLFAGASGAPAQQRVGVSSAVNPDASSRPPGGTVRKLVIGQEIVFNERITYRSVRADPAAVSR